MKDAVLTWDLAVGIKDALTEAGLENRNGVLEVQASIEHRPKIDQKSIKT